MSKGQISDKKRTRLLKRLGIEPQPEVDPEQAARERADAEFAMMGQVLGYIDNARTAHGNSSYIRASRVGRGIGADDSNLVMEIHATLAKKGALVHMSGEKYLIGGDFDDVFLAHMEAQEQKASQVVQYAAAAGGNGGNGNGNRARM
jgi:hypothetical protein